MKLYEITAEYERFLAAIDAGEIPEEAIKDTLESIEALLEDKADNIACMIKQLKAEAAAIKAEEATLADRRKAKENTVERLTTYLSETLLAAGKTKIETARNKISFRKSASVVFDDEAAFVEWARDCRDDLLTYKTPTVNKTAIKEAIANGEAVNGARIESKNNIQIK